MGLQSECAIDWGSYGAIAMAIAVNVLVASNVLIMSIK